MKAIIYQLISPSNKSYIGSTKTSLEKRLSIHSSYLNKGNHTNKRLQGAFNKYESFTTIILEEFDYISNKEVIDKEQYYLDLYKPEYNICKKAYTNEMSIKTREKIKNTLTGNKHSQERINNMKKGKTGVKSNMTLEGSLSISNSAKKQFSKAIIGKNIITKELVEFNSITECEKTLKVDNVSLHIKRIKYKKCGDYVFKFKTDEITDLDNLINNIVLKTIKIIPIGNG